LKHLKLSFLVLFLLLAGCGEKPVITPSPTPIATAPATSTTTAPAASSQAGCTVVSLLPTQGPTQASLFPPVSDQDWVQGPESAKVTIIEYSDFQ
jgi:hypothetical protein